MNGRRACLLAVAMLVAGAEIALAVPSSSALALAIFQGRTIIARHGLQTLLGAQTFSAPSAPWFNQGWMGALGIFLVWSHGGYDALVFASVLLGEAALVLVERRCRQRALGNRATALALLCAVVLSWGVLRVGGGLTDLVFMGAFLLLIERAPNFSALGIIPLTVVWCNVSAYGPIAPFFGALSAMGRTFGQRNLGNRMRRVAFYIAPIAAVLATPATTHVLQYYIADLHLNPLENPHAWKPNTVSQVAFFGGFVPLTIVASWIGLRRAGMSDGAVALGALVLPLINGYYLGLAGIIVGPILGTAFERAWKKTQMVTQAQTGGLLAVSTVAVCVAVAAGFLAHVRGAGLMDGEAERVTLIDRLADDGRQHRLLCLDSTWCNYALMRAAPTLRVFIDGRDEVYPMNVRDDARTIASAQGPWRAALDTWKIDAVVTAPRRLGLLLLLLPEWKRVAVSEEAWMFERSKK